MDSSNVIYTFKTSSMTDKGRITTTVVTHFEPIKQPKKKPCCYRCGRNTHLKSECYATFHLKGYEIDD